MTAARTEAFRSGDALFAFDSDLEIIAWNDATVRNHIRGLLLELGCHLQLEAVAKARRLGLVP